MRLFTALFITLVWLTNQLLADEFTNPSNSVTDLTEEYTIGQVVQLRWETSLTEISHLIYHWGSNAVGSLLSDATNPGAYTWTVGRNDNIDDDAIAKSPNFVLVISDPSGSTGTGNGFVNGQLSSRAFVIRSNTTSAAQNSTSAAAASSATSSSLISSTSSPSTLSTSPSSGTTSGTTVPAAGLSTGAKAGIGVGAGVGALILIGSGVGIAMFAMKRRARGAGSTLPSPPSQVDKNGLYEVESKSRVLQAQHEVKSNSQFSQAQYPAQTLREMDSTPYAASQAMTAHAYELEGGRDGVSNASR